MGQDDANDPVATILRKRASASARSIPTLQPYIANPALMGLHKANPKAIFTGLTSRSTTNTLCKDSTPRSVLSGSTAPATYFLMTAKQCECWTPRGDLLVTEAAQLMEAHGLSDLDAVYAHIAQHELARSEQAANNSVPAAAAPPPPPTTTRERRPSRDFTQDIGVTDFSIERLDKIRRARERSLDEPPEQAKARVEAVKQQQPPHRVHDGAGAVTSVAPKAAAAPKAPQRERRPSRDVEQSVSYMSSVEGLERLRRERTQSMEAEETAAANATAFGRRGRAASESDDIAPTAHMAHDPADKVSAMSFSLRDLEKLRIQRTQLVNEQ